MTTLLGGLRQERFPLYVAVPLGSPDEMTDYVLARRAEGIHRFQLKIGGDPAVDGVRARAAWSRRPGRRSRRGRRQLRLAAATMRSTAARLMEDLPRLYLRAAVPDDGGVHRGAASAPRCRWCYDEIVHDVPTMLRASARRAPGAFNLKVSKVGGLTKAKLMRDLAAASSGMQVTIEDTWGGDIVSAAVGAARGEHARPTRC